MKYFFIVGERSGDLHASNLAKELKRLDDEAALVGYGGPQMEVQGVRILKQYPAYSYMGIWEVFTHLGTIRKTFRACEKAIRDEKPDVLVLVDFPGFNLRMAKYAKGLQLPVSYYISPKIWAWKESRIKKIKAYVNHMMVILPFEVAFYQKHHFKVAYVGNPLMDEVRQHAHEPVVTIKDRPVIAILPGSRKQEVGYAIPLVADLANSRPDYEWVVAGVDNLPEAMYAPLNGLANVRVVYGRTYDILKDANAAVVTSGTATLEACLLNAPQVVIYKTSALTYAVGKRLVKIDFISLVNLIAGKEVVREMIQKDYHAAVILEEVNCLLNDHQYCASMLDEYQRIKEKIGFEPASKRAAAELFHFVRGTG